MPPLCKGRWFGVSRTRGIVQRELRQAPISSKNATNIDADNPSVAPRQLPLHKGAKSVRFCALPFLFHTGTLHQLATPQSATPTAPLRGEPRARNNKHTRPRAPPPSPLSQQSARHKTAVGACIINMRARDALGHIAYCTIRGAQFIHICTK